MALMQKYRYPMHILAPFAKIVVKERVLTANRHLIDAGYKISMTYSLDRKVEYVIAKKNGSRKKIACYFPELISEKGLVLKLYNLVRDNKAIEPPPIDIVYDVFEGFEPIAIPQIRLNPKTTGVLNIDYNGHRIVPSNESYQDSKVFE